MTRRNFLKIGTLGLGALTLPQLLRAESARGAGRSVKSVIMIYLVGGPPHQDMFDLKPLAPKEIAGPWRPIAGWSRILRTRGRAAIRAAAYLAATVIASNNAVSPLTSNVKVAPAGIVQ